MTRALNSYLHGVTAQQVAETARAVVQEFGEGYVYTPPADDPRADEDGICLYVNDGKPSCIVGHIVHRLGVPLEVLRREGDLHLDPKVSHEPMTLSAGFLLPKLGAPDHVTAALNAGQIAQDTRETWGTALARIEEGLA